MRRTLSRALSRKPSEEELSCLHEHVDEGRTVLITGANQGIGLQVAKTLAAASYKVIITSRDIKAGQAAVKDIVKTSGAPQEQVIMHQLDLADFQSIEALVKAIAMQRLDIIICNAGLMCPPFSTTRQGFETTLGVAHHGHFLLLSLLTPKLKSQPFKSRLVVVSSARYLGSRGLDLSDLHYRQKPYRPARAYDDSKLACILFAKEYDQRHSNTTAVAVDPGRCTSTSLSRYLGVSASLSSMSLRTRTKSVQEAAASVIYAAVSRDLYTGAGGSYIEDCKVSQVNATAADKELAAKLWLVTEEEINEAMKN